MLCVMAGLVRGRGTPKAIASEGSPAIDIQLPLCGTGRLAQLHDRFDTVEGDRGQSVGSDAARSSFGGTRVVVGAHAVEVAFTSGGDTSFVALADEGGVCVLFGVVRRRAIGTHARSLGHMSLGERSDV